MKSFAIIAAASSALVCASVASSARPLVTAVSYTGLSSPTTRETTLGFNRVRATGATAFRSTLFWHSTVSSKAADAPKNAADPNDRAYNWSGFDAEMRMVVDAGLTPIVAIYGAPLWARTGDKEYASAPDPAAWRAFVTAAARRYSGRTRGLPRVRYWQVWLEPNLNSKLRPQFEDGQPVSPAIYRRMTNDFATAVKSVRRDNVVIAGGTSPFSDFDPGVQKITERWGPLTFMRQVLCLSRDLKRTCNDTIRFDIWAHHPYTSGGPTRKARHRGDDASLGDLPYIRRVLNVASRYGHIRARGKPKFWVTEFSWDSAPPDAEAVPMPILMRWVPESLYRMWKSGVSLVTWLTLRDNPPDDFVQGGLWFAGRSIFSDRPKPILKPFRFPVVGFGAGSRGVRVWGRTPWGKRGRVIVEQSFRGGWKRLGVVTTDRYGVFQRRFTSTPTGSVRARLVSGRERSATFALNGVRDRFFQPFGTYYCGEPPCKKR